LEGLARRDLHCRGSLNMHRNKVYAVTAIAQQLGVNEDLLHEISIGLRNL
jgi:hypothetical protein